MFIKRLFAIILLASVSTSLGYGQSSSSKIEKLMGGHIQLDALMAGNVWSALRSGRFTPTGTHLVWMDFYQNPAFSAGIQHPFITYYFAPGISIHLNKYLDINSRIQRAINNGISSYRSDSLKLTYPQVKSDFHGNKSWGQGLVSFPAGGMVFTFGYQSQIVLQLRSFLTGTEARITTEVPMSETTSEVVFNAFLDGHVQFDLDVDRTTIGATKVIKNHFAFGFSLDRYGANLQTTGFMDSQGDMLFNGHEYIFNNPNDNWHNTITQFIKGSYAGSGWRTNWGGWYLLNRRFLFDGLLSFQTPIKMMGDLSLQLNKIPALNLDALSSDDPDAEILDPARLNLSQLTFTDSVENPTYAELFLNQQSFLKIGLLYQTKGFYWFNSVVQNFGYTGLGYGPYEIGFHSLFDWRSLLGIHNFYFDIRLQHIKSFIHNSVKLGDKEKKFWVPTLACGYGHLFEKHYPFQVGFLFIPNPTFYLSTGYQF